MEVLSQTAGETVCVSKGSECTWETISELTNGGRSRLQPQTPIKKTARDDRIGATETGRDGTESNSKSDAKPSSKSETSPSEGTESNLLPPNMPSTVDRSPTRPNVSPREHLVRAYNGVSFTANVVTAAAICVLITTRHFATQGSGSYAEESQSTFDSLPSDEMVPLEDMEMDGSEDGGTDEDDSADINTEIDADVTIDVTLESTTMASNADAITDHGDITDLSSADEISTDRDSDARTALSKPQAERSTEASPLPALSPNHLHQQKQKQQPRDEDFVISALSKMACRGILPEWKYNPPEPSSPDVGVGIAHNDHETVVSELTRDSTWTPAPSRLVASIPDKLSSMAIPSGRKWRNRLLARKRQLSKQKIAEREAMEQEQEQNQAEQIQVEKKHEEQQPTQDLSETAVEEVNPNPTQSSASVCASRSLWTEVTVEEDEEEFPTNHRLRSHPFDETNVNDTTYIPWLNPSDEDEGDAVSSVWTEVTVPNQDTESLTAARLGSPFEKTKEDTTNKTQPSESEFSFVTAEGEVDERESLRSFLTAASTAEVEVPPLSMLDADSEHETETDSRCDSMVSVESFAAMYAWLMSNVWATSPNKPKIEIPGDDESTTRESGAPQSLDETAAQDNNDEELDDDINSSTTDTREPAESPCLPDPPSRVVSDRDVYFDSGDEKLNDDPQEQACIELVLDLGTAPSVSSSVTLSERTIRIFTYTLEPSHVSPGPVSTVWCCDWGFSSGFGTEDKGASDGMLSVVPTAMSASYRAYDSGDSSIDSSTLRGSSKTTRTKKKHKPQPWYVVPMKVDLLDPKPVDGDEPSVIRRNEVMRPRNPDDSRFERVMEMVHFRTSLENDCRLPPE